MMKKYLYILLLCSATCCCFHKSIKETYLLNNAEKIYEKKIDRNILFCKTTDSLLIGCTDVLYLFKEIRNNSKYRDVNYKEFIGNLLLYKKKISCNDPILIMCFSLNDSITQLYNKETFETFLSAYVDKEQNNREYQIKSLQMTENSFYTVLYYLYVNGYYSSFDEYSGYWFCRKIDDFNLQLLQMNVYD